VKFFFVFATKSFFICKQKWKSFRNENVGFRKHLPNESVFETKVKLFYIWNPFLFCFLKNARSKHFLGCQACVTIFSNKRFRLVCMQKLIILFPPAKYRFNNSLSLNVFASKGATSAVILGTLVTNKNFLLTIHIAFRASISSFSSLHKLIKAFPVFPRNSGRENLTIELA